MQRKTGVLILTHGSRLTTGNEAMLELVAQVRARLGYAHLEGCFLQFGKPPIPVAIRKLIRQGCNHLFGCALFLAPGSHLQRDIPAIFEQTLKNHPQITWEISPPMITDPLLVDLVTKHVQTALRPGRP